MIDNTVLFLHSITIGYRYSLYILTTLQIAESAVTDIRLCELDWKNFFFLFQIPDCSQIHVFFCRNNSQKQTIYILSQNFREKRVYTFLRIN